MSSWALKAGLAGMAIVAATAYAIAQMGPPHAGMHGPMGQGGQGPQPPMMHGMQGQRGMQGPGRMHHGMGAHGDDDAPACRCGRTTRHGRTGCVRHDPGGRADPGGRSVDGLVEGEHRRVARASHRHERGDAARRRDQRSLDNGVEITVTGEGRTRDAIKRMVPAHAHELGGSAGTRRTEELPNGVKLVVTSTDPKQVVKLKALGFMGIMVQGAHHQPHHLMMAKGEFSH